MDKFEASDRVAAGKRKLKQSSHVGAKGKAGRCRKCGQPFDKKNALKNHAKDCNGVYDKDL